MEVFMDEEEKRLLESYGQLSRSNQLIALAQIIAGAEMEKNAQLTEKQKSLLAVFRQLESEKIQDDLIFQAETMFRAQEALKADYGLVGSDAPLFNGTGAVPGPAA
jgi:hypothetical protein